MFDTYVINLDRDPDKWENIQSVAPMKLKRLQAVDGHTEPGRPFHIPPFIYGSLRSHQKAWGIAAQSDHPILILEDDCVFCENFENRISSIIQTLPDDFDVALFGYMASDINRDYLISSVVFPLMKRRALRKVNDDWYVPGIFIGVHCYLVSPNGAKKLLQNKIIYHVDAMISMDHSLNVYCPTTSLVGQTNRTGQSERIGQLWYNSDVTWEWIMMEPNIALGKHIVLRVYHFVILYVILVVGLAYTPSPYTRLMARIIVAFTFTHYMGIRCHIDHSLRQETNKSQSTHSGTMMMINDSVSSICIFLLLIIGMKKSMIIPVVDTLLIAYVLRAIFVSFAPTLNDPSGECEHRSISKRYFNEYCGSLYVSGHIFPSILLAYLEPRIGIPLMITQIITITASKSHYATDIMNGILLMCFVIYFRRKTLIHKKVV